MREMGKSVCDCIHLNLKILSRENGDKQGAYDAWAFKSQDGFGGLSSVVDLTCREA